MPRSLLFLIFSACVLFLNPIRASAMGTSEDSTRSKILSLDSLSEEDLALLEEYKDSFLLEIKQIKSAMLYKRMKPIDSTVSTMNRSSHFEIGLHAAGPIISNGRSSGLKGAVFTPNIMYYHKWGLFAVLGAGFFTDTTISKSAKLPLLFIAPGIYRTFFDKWSFSLSYARNFIFYGNDVQRGLLNNSFTLFNSFDFWRFITVSVTGGISWSSNLNSKKYDEQKPPPTMPPQPPQPPKRIYYSTITRDAGQDYSANITLTVRRDFSFYNVLWAKVFSISPDINVLFGHDNSTLNLRPQQGQGTVLSSDKYFGFLNVEPGLAVSWRIRNLELFGAAHLAIPFNVYDTNVQARVHNPKLYYPCGEGGIKYLFRIEKKKTRKP